MEASYERLCVALTQTGKLCCRPATRLVYGYGRCNTHVSSLLCTEEHLRVLPSTYVHPEEANDFYLIESHAALNRQSGNKGLISLECPATRRVQPALGHLTVLLDDTLHCSSGVHLRAPLMLKNIAPVRHPMKYISPASNMLTFLTGCRMFSGMTFSDVWMHMTLAFTNISTTRSTLTTSQTMVSTDHVMVYVDNNAQILMYSQLEFLYIFCHVCQRALENYYPFMLLRKRYHDGYNMKLCGLNIPSNLDIYNDYWSGIEGYTIYHILCAMLLVESPVLYPWNIYYATHGDLYPPELDMNAP